MKKSNLPDHIEYAIKRLRIMITLVLCLIGTVVLWRWIIQYPITQSRLASLPLMRLGTAFCFILVGLQLFIFDFSKIITNRPLLKYFLFAPLWFLGLISIVIFSVFQLDTNLNLKHFILKLPQLSVFNYLIELMTPTSSFCFFLLFLGRILQQRENIFLHFSRSCFLSVFLISLISLVGYLFDLFQLMTITTTCLFFYQH